MVTGLEITDVPCADGSLPSTLEKTPFSMKSTRQSVPPNPFGHVHDAPDECPACKWAQESPRYPPDGCYWCGKKTDPMHACYCTLAVYCSMCFRITGCGQGQHFEFCHTEIFMDKSLNVTEAERHKQYLERLKQEDRRLRKRLADLVCKFG